MGSSALPRLGRDVSLLRHPPMILVSVASRDGPLKGKRACRVVAQSPRLSSSRRLSPLHPDVYLSPRPYRLWALSSSDIMLDSSSPHLPPLIPTLLALSASLGLRVSSYSLPDLLLALLRALLPGLSEAPEACSSPIQTLKLALLLLANALRLDLSPLNPHRLLPSRNNYDKGGETDAEREILGRAVVLLALEKGWDGRTESVGWLNIENQSGDQRQRDHLVNGFFQRSPDEGTSDRGERPQMRSKRSVGSIAATGKPTGGSPFAANVSAPHPQIINSVFTPSSTASLKHSTCGHDPSSTFIPIVSRFTAPEEWARQKIVERQQLERTLRDWLLLHHNTGGG